MSAEQLLTGARVVAPDGEPAAGWVHVSGGRIAAVGAADAAPPAGPTVRDLGGRLLAPGFVDVHVHGGDGAEFLGGTPEDVARVARFHARHGTTGLLATTLTASPEALLATVRTVAAHGPVADGAALLGVHLEGPYFNERRRGAQDPAHLREPDPAEIARLIEAGEGAVRMMSLAPELPGALAAIGQLAEAGVVAAIGHSDATYDQTSAAFAAGATHAIHLFNAARPFHHREPGLIGAVLARPDVTCELICDGLHVHPAAIALGWRAKGAGRVALITDAMLAAGLGDGDYRLGALPVRVRDGRAELRSDGALAGSTLTMGAAVRNAVSLAGVPVADALRMASATPARILGLGDRKGAIAAGCDADLVVLGADLAVEAVMVGGRWVGSA